MTTAATFRGDKAEVEDLRERFLTHLGDALARLHLVSADLVLLQSRRDDELVSSGAIDDIAHHIQVAARSVRAGYAVTLAAIEGQLPASVYAQHDMIVCTGEGAVSLARVHPMRIEHDPFAHDDDSGFR